MVRARLFRSRRSLDQAPNPGRAGRLILGVALCSLLVSVGTACTAGDETPVKTGAGDGEPAQTEAASAGAEDGTAKVEAPKSNLPAAEDLLAAHVEAAGGADKIAQFQSVYFEGKIEVLKQNLGGTARQWWKGGKFLGEEEIAGIGNSRAGFDGEVIWSDDPIMGLRVLEGKERELYHRSSSLFLNHEWKQHFETAETIGEAVVDGHEIYEVKLTSKLGQEVVMGFDADTKLLYSTKFKQIGPTGEMPVETYAEDYREVEGFKFAHRSRLKVPPLMEIVQTMEKIEVNLEIDDAMFGMPGGEARVPADPSKQVPAAKAGGSAPPAP